MLRRLTPLLGLLVCLLLPHGAYAEAPHPPLLTLIIDDLGERWDYGQRALSLPAPVTYAIMPDTRFGRRIAEMAHGEGREVMLHQPMEAQRPHRLGPGGLVANMGRDEFLRTLRRNLDALPFVNGVNNHMGSGLTRNPEAMSWLVEELQRRNLYFVDSRTTNESVARNVAIRYGLPSLTRDIFLDNDRTNSAIEQQLIEAVRHAHLRGTTIAIGHPYPETLTVLELALPHMAEMGVKVVSVSQMIEARQQRSYRLWHASLSPLPTVAKSSKP